MDAQNSPLALLLSPGWGEVVATPGNCSFQPPGMRVEPGGIGIHSQGTGTGQRRWLQVAPEWLRLNIWEKFSGKGFSSSGQWWSPKTFIKGWIC